MIKNAATCDLSDVLPEDIEADLKQAAQVLSCSWAVCQPLATTGFDGDRGK